MDITEEKNQLASLLSYECTLNNMINEFLDYEATSDVANEMLSLNDVLLEKMLERAEHIGIEGVNENTTHSDFYAILNTE